MRDDDGLSPGDIGDPVADNIRAEMNRDAAPLSDREREERREVECDECGAEGEFGEDIKRRSPLSIDCPAVQPPGWGAVRMLCDECAEAREHPIERAKRRARERYDAGFVVFECGELRPFDVPEHPGSEPYAPVRCRCGSEVDEVVYLDDDG